jgi:extracellular elastinolytic metalloproteinase
MLTPIDALVSLLPRISEVHGLAPSTLDFTSHSEHTLLPKQAPAEPPTEHISGPGLAAAGVVSNVPARLMYTQTSDQPRLVWKLEVEMQNNWYEAYVDTISGELLRIVDWSNDFTWHSKPKSKDMQIEESLNKGGKQKPLPAPPKHNKPYSYDVFPWGKP